MEIKLRLASPGDAQTLADIYSYYVENTAVSFECQAPTAAEFAQRIAGTLEFYPYIVCELDGVITGYAYAHKYQLRPAYRWNSELSVYLKHGCCGQGAGTALYAALIRLLEKQNIYNIYGLVTLPNAASEALHRHFGFQLTGVFHNTGYKAGAWRDVGIFEYMLEKPVNPPEPASIRSLDEAFVKRVLEGKE